MTHSAQHHLDQLRQHRVRRDLDLSLSFLAPQFKREIERPYKQLKELVALWLEHVPDDLAKRTRLEGLSRGVLRVSVESSVYLYELDRLLRSGLERRIVTAYRKSAMRRIQLRVAQTPMNP